jgi:REP element-mobilizing transposase RayT
MPRGPRISYPNAVFHVINRFVDRHPFFRTRTDYLTFLDIYFDVAGTFGLWTYSYDLMPNHFHFVLETPSGEISKFLQRFLTRAVQHLNAKHGRVGHLLQGRTKTLLVEKDRYLSTVIGYVLLNRVRAGLAPDVFSDPYNSANELLTCGASRLAREPWCRVDANTRMKS